MADNVRMDVDLSEFSQALREYLTYSKLDVAEAVNKKAGDVAFSAVKHIKSGSEVTKEIRRLGKGSRLFHALATGKTKLGESTKGAAVKGKGNKKVADAIFASRVRHGNYSRALFLYLASKFGKKVSKLKKTNRIENAKATKAPASGKFDKPQAVLEIIGVESSHEPLLSRAMQKGIDAQVEDMRRYINRKISERARKHSGRRR